MKKIIAFTSKNDFHTLSVKKQLQDIGCDLIALDRESYGENWLLSSLSIEKKSSIFLELNDEIIPFDKIGAIWNRRDFTINYSDNEIDPETHYINSQKSILVNSLLKYMDDKVPCMNKIQSNWLANSKYLQSEIARASGLLCPETFQGGSVDLAHQFLEKSVNHKTCIKALEAIHLKRGNDTYAHYTSIFEPKSKDQLASIRSCPIVLQKFIEKDYEIRATVIGNEVFSASIDTKKASDDAKIDWRHYDWANTPYLPIDLPLKIKESLIEINRELKLVYGAYDLIKTKEGEYYFLEVNPQGQWLWIEDLTALPISKTIAKWLFNAAKYED